MDTDYSQLEKSIGYKFKNISLLKCALVHTSYANERGNGIKSNERIEFLGDAVLQLVSSEYIYETYPMLPEGSMSKLRSKAVCENALAKISLSINLDKYILLGKGESISCGNKKPSLLSDAMESVFAAVFLDSDYDTVKKVILNLLIPIIDSNEKSGYYNDSKSRLQEMLAKDHRMVSYEIIDESGPDHNKTFTAKVMLDDGSFAVGSGKTKKEAEQHAAAKMIDILNG